MVVRRRPSEFWAEQVRLWRASGETRAAFASRAGINGKTLGWWAWRLEREATGERSDARPDEPEPLRFIEVTPVVADERIELKLDGVTVRVPRNFETETLARALDVLRSARRSPTRCGLIDDNNFCRSRVASPKSVTEA